MCIQAAVSCTAAAIGDVFGFIASRWILTSGIAAVRTELDSCISTLARERLGEWVGRSIGFQCSLVLANPVASLIGSLVWTCISDAVQSFIRLFAEIIGLIRQKGGTLRSLILTGVRVSCTVVGFFIKRTIINYAVPVSIVSAEVAVKTVLPYLATHTVARVVFQMLISLSGAAFVPLSIAITAEAVAFVAKQVLSIFSNSLCDKYLPEPSPH